jgi:hypothetical protein
VGNFPYNDQVFLTKTPRVGNRGGNTSWDYGTIDFGILWNSLELIGIIFGIPQKFV